MVRAQARARACDSGMKASAARRCRQSTGAWACVRAEARATQRGPAEWRAARGLPGERARPVRHALAGRLRAFGRNGATSPTSASSTASIDSWQTGEDTILTVFAFPGALCGSSVQIAGSFNGWQKAFNLRRIQAQDSMTRTVLLPPGQVEYKYIVDDVWRYSPQDLVVRDDEQGSINNFKHISANAVLTWSSPAREVFLAGSFSDFRELIPLQRQPDGTFSVKCCLPYGRHCVRFLVDNNWMVASDLPQEEDPAGLATNVVAVQPKHSFHIFYSTGWEDAFIRFRMLDEHSMPVSQWEETPLVATKSAEGPWRAVSVPAVRDSANLVQPCQLEFSVLNRYGEEDRPGDGGFYQLRTAGGYKLSHGSIRPFPQASAGPVMLVSDVDGTMIDEDDAAVAAASEFRDYWENVAALCGSVLVYNTGRSVGQLTGLMDYRSGSMAVPDAMITAVGTKVFLPNRRHTRTTVDADSWEEDGGWKAILDYKWDLDVVRRAADSCACDRVHWLDDGSEHPHRIALSVHHSIEAEVGARIRAFVEQQGFAAQVVCSGVGEYRYVDVLAVQGGKRNAMEYVRRIYGVSPERVVTAGDSGNDILMLEGDNPGIIVGNAQPALVDWSAAQDQRTGRIVLTDKAGAAGILEGLARHGLY